MRKVVKWICSLRKIYSMASTCFFLSSRLENDFIWVGKCKNHDFDVKIHLSLFDVDFIHTNWRRCADDFPDDTAVSDITFTKFICNNWPPTTIHFTTANQLIWSTLFGTFFSTFSSMKHSARVVHWQLANVSLQKFTSLYSDRNTSALVDGIAINKAEIENENDTKSCSLLFVIIPFHSAFGWMRRGAIGTLMVLFSIHANNARMCWHLTIEICVALQHYFEG